MLQSMLRLLNTDWTTGVPVVNKEWTNH